VCADSLQWVPPGGGQWSEFAARLRAVAVHRRLFWLGPQRAGPNLRMAVSDVCPLLDQWKVQVDSKGYLALALYLEIELPFEFAQIEFMSSSLKCKINFDIELQIVFNVIHGLVSRTRCQSQSRDDNATRIGQDQGIALLGSCPSTPAESLEIDHEIDLVVILVTLCSY
jgi:hypothetical protein